jgi:hypothetical protein
MGRAAPSALNRPILGNLSHRLSKRPQKGFKNFTKTNFTQNFVFAISAHSLHKEDPQGEGARAPHAKAHDHQAHSMSYGSFD